MRKITSWLLIVVLLFPSVFFQGCATVPFTKKDMSTISPLKVVRYETPRIKVEETFGYRTLIGVIVAGTLPTIGLPIALSIPPGKLEKEAPIPDFGKLVMDKFVERASKEVPDWPTMTLEEQPIGGKVKFGRNYSYKSGALLAFGIHFLTIADFGSGNRGFSSRVSATIKDSEGGMLWYKEVFYKSGKFDIKRSIEEYKADNFKLLREEMEFAAEKIVSDLIEHFKGGGKE